MIYWIFSIDIYVDSCIGKQCGMECTYEGDIRGRCDSKGSCTLDLLKCCDHMPTGIMCKQPSGEIGECTKYKQCGPKTGDE